MDVEEQSNGSNGKLMEEEDKVQMDVSPDSKSSNQNVSEIPPTASPGVTLTIDANPTGVSLAVNDEKIPESSSTPIPGDQGPQNPPSSYESKVEASGVSLEISPEVEEATFQPDAPESHRKSMVELKEAAFESNPAISPEDEKDSESAVPVAPKSHRKSVEETTSESNSGVVLEVSTDKATESPHADALESHRESMEKATSDSNPGVILAVSPNEVKATESPHANAPESHRKSVPEDKEDTSENNPDLILEPSPDAAESPNPVATSNHRKRSSELEAPPESKTAANIDIDIPTDDKPTKNAKEELKEAPHESNPNTRVVVASETDPNAQEASPDADKNTEAPSDTRENSSGVQICEEAEDIAPDAKENPLDVAREADEGPQAISLEISPGNATESGVVENKELDESTRMGEVGIKSPVASKEMEDDIVIDYDFSNIPKAPGAKVVDVLDEKQKRRIKKYLVDAKADEKGNSSEEILPTYNADEDQWINLREIPISDEPLDLEREEGMDFLKIKIQDGEHHVMSADELLEELNELEQKRKGGDAFLFELEAEALEEEIILGSLPMDEIKDMEHALEVERIEKELERRNQQDKLLGNLIERTKGSVTALDDRYEADKKNIFETKKRLREVYYQRLKTKDKVYKQVSKILTRRVALHRKAVNRYFGSLAPSESMTYEKSGGFFQRKIKWRNVPTILRIRMKCLRAIKNKLPGGKYFVMATLCDRIAGHPLQRLRHRVGSGMYAQDVIHFGTTLQDVVHFGTTQPASHTGHFLSTEMKWDKEDAHIFVACPSDGDLQPAMCILFELILSRTERTQHDVVMGWGVFPLCTEHIKIISGSYKVPLLRGAVNKDLTKYSDIENTISSNVDSWLCNAYFDVRQRSRSTRGVNERLCKNERTDKILMLPQREDAKGENSELSDSDFSQEILNQGDDLIEVEDIHHSGHVDPVIGEEPISSENSGLGSTLAPLARESRSEYEGTPLLGPSSGRIRPSRRFSGPRSLNDLPSSGRHLITSRQHTSRFSAANVGIRTQAKREQRQMRSSVNGSSITNRHGPTSGGKSLSRLSTNMMAPMSRRSPRSPRSTGRPFAQRRARTRIAKKTRSKNNLDKKKVAETSEEKKTEAKADHEQKDEKDSEQIRVFGGQEEKKAEEDNAEDDGFEKDAIEFEKEMAKRAERNNRGLKEYHFSIVSSESHVISTNEFSKRAQFLAGWIIGDLRMSRMSTLEFWTLIMLAVVGFYWRMFVHFCGEYYFLKSMSLHPYYFECFPYNCYIEYSIDTTTVAIEIAMTVMGQLWNALGFCFGCVVFNTLQQCGFHTPDFLSRVMLVYGLLCLFDPLFVLIGDCVRFHKRGDLFKLFYYFQYIEEDIGGPAGAMFTILLVAVSSVCMLAVFVWYLMTMHMGGRTSDIYSRTHQDESHFFVPHDMEISTETLRYLIIKAKRYRSFEGNLRRIYVTSYIERDHQDIEFDRRTTHIALFTWNPVNPNRVGDMYRQFLWRPDGAILEVFADSDDQQFHALLRKIKSMHHENQMNRDIMQRESKRFGRSLKTPKESRVSISTETEPDTPHPNNNGLSLISHTRVSSTPIRSEVDTKESHSEINASEEKGLLE